MYVIRSIGKPAPYGIVQAGSQRPTAYLPPWTGRIEPVAEPDATGHFDRIPVDSPLFERAHVFGSVRFTIDVWEALFGFHIPWHFSPAFQRLEINILPTLNNAHAGFGFLEVGAFHHQRAPPVPYSLNFDVIAHEVGHLLIYSVVGVPSQSLPNDEYFGFHESAADLTALIASMHFEALLSGLLDVTHGNLYTFNELNRFAETSPSDQIRMASNDVTLWDFRDGWTDEHALSQPLTGAVFDALVDVFQERLVDAGAISRELAEVTRVTTGHGQRAPDIQAKFDRAYAHRGDVFREALLHARDYMGALLAQAWRRLSADGFDYQRMAEVMLELDQAATGGRYRRALAESFLWRGIGLCRPGPRLKPPGPDSHGSSVRTLVPATYAQGMTGRAGLASAQCRCRLQPSWGITRHG